MKCKFCQAEIEEGTLCPVCGKENLPDEVPCPQETDAASVPPEETQEQAELSQEKSPELLQQTPSEPEKEATMRAGMATWKVVLITLACTALVCALVVAIVFGVKSIIKANSPEQRTGYTVDDAAAQSMRENAAATVDGYTLTNGQLQIYYWMQFYDLVENNYDYVLANGLDVFSPLDGQVKSEQDGTWQDFLLKNALEMWHRYQTLAILAENAGMELDEQFQKGLDEIPAKLEEDAKNSGYESAEEMLHDQMGAGCNVDDYVTYLRTYYLGYQYFSQEFDKLSPTDEQIEAYFTEHEQKFTSSGIKKDGSRLASVRHILLRPEDGTTDASGETTYTDEQWEACRAEAQALYDEWLAGKADEESFSALAKEHSADSSASNGGLIPNFASGRMVKEFNDWSFDESRAYGDHALIKTEFGYHLMYFVSATDTWYYYAKSSLLSELSNQMVEDALEEHPMTVSYENIGIATVDISK